LHFQKTTKKSILLFMSNIRISALDTVQKRERIDVKMPSARISEYFGSNVFNDEAMRKYLSEEAYLSVKASIESGNKIDRKMADQIASSLKAWAIAKGATHFCHWFQPLTGLTAEKHDTFFSPTGGGKGIENFNGDALVQQEPDASSFPSGGIRSTFEARGYTAWDPTSPAFIMHIGEGKTLCIPTIFVSYTGDVLDYKAPLLRSMQYIEKAAVAVCQYFDKTITKVYPTLGWEQEYFLIDSAMFNARPDLLLSGRTLLGHSPSKGQELEDHYFGTIPERIYAFMIDFETEALKLGIPVKTRHNEVAPSQYECAPVFEEVNIAVDHNQLLMDLLDRVSRRHNLRVLLHEKPFAGINGSGKHNNWSMGTNTGKNLLSPGKTPKNNLQFLTFFVCTVKSVAEYSDLIRASIASAPNDHRLGANEAPPAIISVFIGKHMKEVLDEVEKKIDLEHFDEQDKADLKLNIHNKIPDLMLDNTDRNRTSPFAFTGNKFEVRAVGSSANCSSTMTVLNTIVGKVLENFKEEVDVFIEKGEKKEVAILKVLRSYITSSKKIIFEGDNYSKEWEKEAARRGLSNVKTTPHALDFYMSKKSKELFTKSGVLSATELEARYEIQQEIYAKKLDIETKVLRDLVWSYVMPAAVKYQNLLLENVNGLKTLKAPAAAYKTQLDLLNSISTDINTLRINVDKMLAEKDKADKAKNAHERAALYCDKVKPLFDIIRNHADRLELVCDDSMWTLPKYRDLLFIK
jgi:glutamine synthetase